MGARSVTASATCCVTRMMGAPIEWHVAPAQVARQVWLSGSHVFPLGSVGRLSPLLMPRTIGLVRTAISQWVAGHRVAPLRAHASGGVRTSSSRCACTLLSPGSGIGRIWLSGNHGQRPASVGRQYGAGRRGRREQYQQLHGWGDVHRVPVLRCAAGGPLVGFRPVPG